MTAQIIPLTSATHNASPIAHYLRIGETGHRKLDDLLAADKLPATRYVVSASAYQQQVELVDELRRLGFETILDTKVAELAEPGKFQGYSSRAPWAVERDSELIGIDAFEGESGKELLKSIAVFAIENSFDAVLAPCHFLRTGPNDQWFNIDRRSCEILRSMLDSHGGSEIQIDYSLIISHTKLRDSAYQNAFVAALRDLPIDQVWIRASGFGTMCSPAGARHYINSLSGMHGLQKPIIADHVGGIVGLATTAFGASSGLAHGLGEMERFDAGGWHKSPPPRHEQESHGRMLRIFVPGIDRSVTVNELRALARARGGHRFIVCNDRSCCPHGLQDQISNWRSHVLHHQFGVSRRMAGIPDLRRSAHFLNSDLAFVDQQSRQIKELSPVVAELRKREGESLEETAASLMKRLANQSIRNEKLRAALEDLMSVLGEGATRSPASLRRASSRSALRGS